MTRSLIRSGVPPLIVLACLIVLGLTICNFFGFLLPRFPARPDFLPHASVVCEGRVARMSDVRSHGMRLWVNDLYCRDGAVMRAIPGTAQLTILHPLQDLQPDRRSSSFSPLPLFLIGETIRFRSHLHTPHGYHNPGAIDWERKAASDGVAWTGAIESPEWIMVVKSGYMSPVRAIDRWRQALSQQIAEIPDPDIRGSAAALLLGSAGLLPEKFTDGLRYLGIIHLYVISGLHVTVVAWGMYEILYWLFSRRVRWALRYPLWRWAAAGSLLAVWVYVGLVGGGVAVVRAGIMVSVYLVALILDRHPHVGTAIALAALILLAQSPHVLFIPGFQLSFAAVIALVTVYPRVLTWVAGRWSLVAGSGGSANLPSNKQQATSDRSLSKQRFAIAQNWTATGLVLKAIIATFVATWATLPILAWHFHQTPLLGIPANLIAGPYTTVVLMPIGFAWTVLAGIPGVALVLQQFWAWAAWPLVRTIQWVTPITESTQWTFTPTFWEVLWWYSPIIFLWRCFFPPLMGEDRGEGNGLQTTLTLLPRSQGAHSRWGRRGTMMVWCLCGLFFISLRLYDYYRPQSLQLTFLDVGQGASVLVEFPDLHTMLIDAGGVPGSEFDIGRWVVAPALLARGITHIDDLILTHPHPDHYGGLGYIAEHFYPRHLYTNGSPGEEGDLQWQAFVQRMQTARIQPEILRRGMQTSHGGVQVTWLHPPETGPDESQGKNNGSIVTDLQYGNFRAVIVGDIQEEAEEALLKDHALGTVSVMQVPHHASRTSSTPEFLQRVRPQLAVAQMGFENRYGFPHAEVVRRYEEMGIPLCRSDRDGAVTITANSPTTQFSIRTDRSSGTCSARLR